MVPATKILETACAGKIDSIGLSGLMGHVAAKMEPEGLEALPIGGEATSRVHTAVTVHPRYELGRPSTSTTPVAPWMLSAACCRRR